MIVVTGATGHIGNVLVKQLCQKNKKDGPIRVLVPPGETMEPLTGTVVELCVCDVCDYGAVLGAVRGADILYHLAGIVSIVGGQRELLERVNVRGVDNVLRAAREGAAGRVVYVSSVHAFVEPPRSVAVDETAPVDPERVRGDYARSKARGTLLARAAARAGQDVVIVHPTGVYGPYEYKNSHTGAMLKGAMNRRYPMKFGGSYDYVDVRDVATGIRLAARRGRAGESYILGGNHLSVAELFEIVARLCGRKPPRLDAPLWLIKAVAPLAERWSKLRRKTPTLTSYALQTLLSNSNISSEKAKRELGYSARPAATTIADFIRWARREEVDYF